MARGLLSTHQRLEKVRPPRGQTTLAAGSKHFGRPKAASEPADHVATSLPDHEHCSRAFLSTPGLGLFPRFAELASIGLRPFRAFTIGALVAVPLGHALSTTVLSTHWARI